MQPYDTRNEGKVVWDAYALKTVAVSEGLKALSSIRTTTSPARSSPGSETLHTDHHGVNGAGCFSDSSKHTFSLVQMVERD